MKFNNQPEIIDKQAFYTVTNFDLPTYEDFLKIRTLPHYTVRKNKITFDASYIDHVITEQTKLPVGLQKGLFDYQEVICKVAFYKERYAIYADAGLGKTGMLYQLALLIIALSQKTIGKIIVCVPLTVLHQFIEMSDFFDAMPEMINLHNNKLMSLKEWCHYDNVPRIGFINHHAFIKPQELINVDAFLLDECHILRGGKGGSGKISKNLIANTKGIKYKIAASATPAPNDPAEYGMVELFLEYVNSYKEFEQAWFVNKANKLTGNKMVLRRHSHKQFYSHLASYSIFIKNPSAYGFNDNLVNLPPYRDIHKRIDLTPEQEEVIKKYAIDKNEQMMLPSFVYKPAGIVERNKFSEISKGFLYLNQGKKRIIQRIKSNKPNTIMDCVLSHPDEQIIIAVYFDEEGKILHELLTSNGIDAIHLTGKNKLEDKVNILNDFRLDKFRVLIAQVGLIATGLNLQFCRINIISGMTDSYAEHYQFKKRTHRLGQTKEVLFYYFYTHYEEVILSNVFGKEKQHATDIEYQERLYKDSLYDELKDFLKLGDYVPMNKQIIQHQPLASSNYQIYHSDCKKVLFEVEQGSKEYGWLLPDSIDLSVFSKPFMGDVLTYSSHPADMSNHRGTGATAAKDEFMLDLGFFFNGMYTVTKPGRLMCCHIEDVPLRKNMDGHSGIFDFPGHCNIAAADSGWILVAKITIPKNQQMQGSVKHVSNLSMSNQAIDRLRLAPAMNGYFYIYRKPGEADARVADVYKCRKCEQEGYCSDLLGYNLKTAKRQFDIKMPHYQQLKCPNCQKNNPFIFSEIDGDKWVMYAEGVWPENGFNEDFKYWANKKKADRWLDLVYGSLGVWPDILEHDVLKNPFRGAKNANDLEDADKHLCPLPRSAARRAIELYSNPGELVLTPFMGSGTEVVEALSLGRKAIGLELHHKYFTMSHTNIEQSISQNGQYEMFP